MVGLVTGHPHPAKREDDFDPSVPCTHFVQSPAFARAFGKCDERDVFELVVGYCNAARGGPLGGADIVLHDDDGMPHQFVFETVKWGYALTLGMYRGPHRLQVAV